MDSDQTWAIFWFSIAVLICGVVVSCSKLGNDEDARKAQDMKAMIASGASPIEARCAVYGTAGNGNDGKNACLSIAVSNGIIKSLKTNMEK